MLKIQHIVPKRGMFAGGQGGSIKKFPFRFKLPMGIYGEKVLLLWKYLLINLFDNSIKKNTSSLRPNFDAF
jgi:hypothetical protein